MHKIKYVWVVIASIYGLWSGIDVAQAQITWTENPLNPVLGVGPASFWDSGIAFQPYVINAGDTLKMWYAGADRGAAFARPEIGYAWSLDGVAWNRPANPVFLRRGGEWDAGQVENPVVFQDGDTLRLWYSGFGDGVAGKVQTK